MPTPPLLHVSGAVGLDEAGRGPLAGPVVVAAVRLPDDHGIEGLGDSKKLTERRREALEPRIRAVAEWSVVAVEADEVDRLGILPATFEGFRRAAAGVSGSPLLVDGNLIPPGLGRPARAEVKGDARFAAIAAASVLAKVERDRRMVAHAAEFPGYGFEGHKGYGSAAHLEAIARLGPCPIHRRSFAPFRTAQPPNPPTALGRAGEDLAAEHLRALGYTLVTRRWRTPGGELDLVALDGETLVFVEVKTRRGEEALIGDGQFERLLRASEAYRAEFVPEPREGRFDVVLVGPEGVRHLKDAFR